MTDSQSEWDWNVGGIINHEPASEKLIPGLSLAAGLVLIDCLIKTIKSEDKKKRLRKARTHLTRKGEEELRAMDPAANVSLQQDLNALIHKKLPEGLCLSLMVTAITDNPVAPFQIKLATRDKEKALSLFASSLGVPKSWADAAAKAADDAAKAHKRVNTPFGYLIAVLGGGLALAAVPLALAFAPAGLAGGAAILAGLSALGPGGLMGGLSIMSAVATAGGLTAASGLYVAGSAEQVEARVILLHALCLAKRRLRPGTPSMSEVKLFERMKETLDAEKAMHTEVDDKWSQALKDIGEKLATIDRALKHLSSKKE